MAKCMNPDCNHEVPNSEFLCDPCDREGDEALADYNAERDGVEFPNGEFAPWLIW